MGARRAPRVYLRTVCSLMCLCALCALERVLAHDMLLHVYGRMACALGEFPPPVTYFCYPLNHFIGNQQKNPI